MKPHTDYPVVRAITEADPAHAADLNWLIVPGERPRYYQGHPAPDGVRWVETSGTRVMDLLKQRASLKIV
jgi:hypothetical protein